MGSYTQNFGKNENESEGKERIGESKNCIYFIWHLLHPLCWLYWFSCNLYVLICLPVIITFCFSSYSPCRYLFCPSICLSYSLSVSLCIRLFLSFLFSVTHSVPWFPSFLRYYSYSISRQNIHNSGLGPNFGRPCKRRNDSSRYVHLYLMWYMCLIMISYYLLH